MTKYDKYIFGILFLLCMVMILSCKDSSNNIDRPVETEMTSDKTYTSEGTISSGTKDTMNDHTNGIKTNDGELPSSPEVPIKGETAANANDVK